MHSQIIVYLILMLSGTIDLNLKYNITEITGDGGLRIGRFLGSIGTVRAPESIPEEHSGGLCFSSIDILGTFGEKLRCYSQQY